MTELERDEDGKPLPDGGIEIVVGTPLDPLADLSVPESYFVYYHFKELSKWDMHPSGIMVVDKDDLGSRVIPWSNVRTWYVRHNTEEYRDQLDRWVLKCDHTLVPDTTDPRGDGKYCSKCLYTKSRIEETQKLFDKRMLEELEHDDGKKDEDA